MPLPPIDKEYLIDFLVGLLETPSPTGFTREAVTYTERAMQEFPELELRRTRKGALIASLEAGEGGAPRAVTAHLDTLGAMVKEVKSNGRLRLSRLGGFAWNTVEGEGCTIFTGDGRKLRGSLLLDKASSHVHGAEVSDRKREEANMEVRLDARSESEEDTSQLGVSVGDFVAFDPRVELNEGFIRSRYLDDKACVACLVSAAHSLSQAGMKPKHNALLLFSNYEEVGHGASSDIPADVAELLVVDMAAVGEGQASDEFHATVCVKDSTGPYDYELSRRLRNLAEQHEIPFVVDIYPYYGSDGGAFWRSGGSAPVALIGPGVDASHNYERTHIDALVATTQWVLAYLLEEK